MKPFLNPPPTSHWETCDQEGSPHTHSMVPTEDLPKFMGRRTLHPGGAGEQPPNHLPTTSPRDVQDGAEFGLVRPALSHLSRPVVPRSQLPNPRLVAKGTTTAPRRLWGWLELPLPEFEAAFPCRWAWAGRRPGRGEGAAGGVSRGPWRSTKSSRGLAGGRRGGGGRPHYWSPR